MSKKKEQKPRATPRRSMDMQLASRAAKAKQSYDKLIKRVNRLKQYLIETKKQANAAYEEWVVASEALRAPSSFDLPEEPDEDRQEDVG